MGQNLISGRSIDRGWLGGADRSRLLGALERQRESIVVRIFLLPKSAVSQGSGGVPQYNTHGNFQAM